MTYSDQIVQRLRAMEAHLLSLDSGSGEGLTCKEATDEIERIRAENAKLRRALQWLHAMVWGESQALLNEDSGGDARLDSKIRKALGDD